MKRMNISLDCRDCLKRKFLIKTENTTYLNEVTKLIDNAPNDVLAACINAKASLLYDKYLGKQNHQKLKKYYNDLMVTYEPMLNKIINDSSDTLSTVLKLALVGNFIDFSAYQSIDENKLLELINNADSHTLDDYDYLLEDLKKAKTLLYITDNCGEIVIDKLVIKELKKLYPNLNIIAMVRKKEVGNDASMFDALDIGLDKICEIIDNGIDYDGTPTDELPIKQKEIVLNSDVIIAKGQANAESMIGCNLNVYYLFLCKCDYFSRKFNVPKLTGMLKNEKLLNLKNL